MAYASDGASVGMEDEETGGTASGTPYSQQSSIEGNNNTVVMAGHISVTVRQESKPDLEEILSSCQEILEKRYTTQLCKIPQYPGSKVALNMDDIFTNISIAIQLAQPANLVTLPMTDYLEMLQWKSNNGTVPSRMLIIGEGGSGKTTLTAKIAHEWVKGNALHDILLLFVLNLRKISDNSTLEDAIYDQLMPSDVEFSKESLCQYIKDNQEKVMFIFDSYDEFCRKGSLQDEPRTDVIQMLSYNALIKCRVIVTSRPWKQKDFSDFQRVYTTFQLNGFTVEQVEIFVKKFFGKDSSKAESLLEYLKSNDFCPGIASVPLMTQLFCWYWMKIGNTNIPKKIGQMYTCIIEVMWRHSNSKNKYSTDVCNRTWRDLGKSAFSGLWLPNNQLVFQRQELEEITSGDDTVAIALQAAILSSEDNIKTESNPCKQGISLFDDELEQSTDAQSLRFSHKTIQEKCAGEYLGKESPSAIEEQLNKITTIDLCLKVQMILQFACGTSMTATKIIMNKLKEIFQNHICNKLQQYYQDNLEEQSVRTIQQFIELCLICNYESGAEKEFQIFLNSLFPNGQMRFLGMSAHMGNALEHFLSHNNNTRSITILEMPREGDTIYYLAKSKVLQDAHRDVHKKLKQEESSTLQEMFEKCVKKKILSEDRPNITNALGDVQIWEKFSTLQPASDINFNPMLKAFQHIHLAKLDITDVKLGKQCESLITCIEEKHLQSAVKLLFKQIGLTSQQVSRLVTAMEKHKLPALKVLDISRNKSHIPAKLGKVVNSLQMTSINVAFVTEHPHETSDFVKCLSDCGQRLEELRIEGNPTNQDVGDTLRQSIPMMSQTQSLGIQDIPQMDREAHKEMLNNLKHLCELRELRIWGITIYLDDVLDCIANVLPTLQQLCYLSLRADGAPKTTSKSLGKLLRVLDGLQSIRKLRLYGVYLDNTDFNALVEIGRTHNYEYLCVFRSMLSDDVDVPSDDFIRIY